MRILVSTAAVILSAAAAMPAPAQTVFTLGNGVGATLTAAETNLDLNNTSVAFSTGGFGAAAVSLLRQSATNELNVLNLLGASGMAPAGGAIHLNMLFGSQPVSLTTVNTAGAVASGINPIIGAAALNTPWTGGYGGASGPALVGGRQSGLNAMNGVVVAVAPGSTLSLVQQAGPLALLPLAQTAMLNASISNTWFASSLNGGASINGAAGMPNTGLQLAGLQNSAITVNGAVIVGGGILDVQQHGVSPFAAFQVVNRAGAFTNTALTPSFSLR